MLENRTVYLNGAFVPWMEATLPIMSHSLGRGTAIFDVLSFGETKSGRAIFRLDEHVARFMRSASVLGMTSFLSAEELTEAVKETVRRNTPRKGAIKITGFHPEPSFALLPPEKPFQVAVFVFDPDDDFGEKPMTGDESVTALVSRWRRLDPLTVPVEAKVAANYLNGIVARTEAKNLGFDYAIMLDLEGNIAEGGTESVFLVRDGRLLTPNIGHILQGITRKSVLAVAEAMGIETYAGALKEELLNQADEIFFSGTIHRVLPVSRMGNRILPETPGPITKMIAAGIARIVSGRDPRFHDWLFPV
jgi:branched-chain amino acid aminotransferase